MTNQHQSSAPSDILTAALSVAPILLFDFFLPDACTQAMIHFHIMVLTDNFDGCYSNQDSWTKPCWIIYTAIAAAFLALTLFRQALPLSKILFWTHTILGGLWIAFVCRLENTNAFC